MKKPIYVFLLMVLMVVLTGCNYEGSITVENPVTNNPEQLRKESLMQDKEVVYYELYRDVYFKQEDYPRAIFLLDVSKEGDN